MEEYLPFVSIDIWTMIFTWANLIILFLLLKKFLFKPVNKMLAERAAEIEDSYKAAGIAESKAENMKAEYEGKLLSAKAEADGIIKTALETADRRSDSIVTEASDKARHIMEKSRKQAERDKKNAVNEARADIAKMAADIAEKLIGKRFGEDDDEKLISDLIDRI
ncbi:MAG: F0F1 ATP synthase subunit B [Oscillospiraceae bacterium]|nr:F0F1 ATP synthase subunit B [Oscillospiraceae bacterium]